ncbi:MAG: tRNA pseudouridine(38-40) synthase TruA [Pirellula sp.]
MRQFAMTIAYDGTRYGGWQIQPNARTVQQTLIEAIEQSTSEQVHVQGSGRTDSGVHALGQVGSFVLERWNPTADKLVPAINRYLPRDIVVRECRDVILHFDPIRQAKSKRYRYTIRNSRIPDPMTGRYHWWIPKTLDIAEMRNACGYLVGTHDFKAFETTGSPRKSTTRTVYELAVRTIDSMDGVDVHIEIEADGFLYNMVRNIVGALWSVGSGRYGARWIKTFIDARERDTTHHTAPAHGLCLLHVTYPDEVFET